MVGQASWWEAADEKNGINMKIINHVLYSGTAVPVVLIHAFPVDHRMWLTCARHLTQQAEEAGLESFSVYAPDMPGAGLSPVPSLQDSGARDADGAYYQALDLLAESYVDMLSALGHQKAIWVGLSMGGYVTAAIQRLHPECVAGLAFCDTNVVADTPDSKVNRMRVAQLCEQEDSVREVMSFAQPTEHDSTIKHSSEFVAMFSAWIKDQNPAGIAWRERMAAGRPDQSEILPEVTAPVAVISGELDPSSPPERMASLVQGLTATEPMFTTIANCGHFSAVEHPDTVARVLVELVQRVQKS